VFKNRIPSPPEGEEGPEIRLVGLLESSSSMARMAGPVGHVRCRIRPQDWRDVAPIVYSHVGVLVGRPSTKTVTGRSDEQVAPHVPKPLVVRNPESETLMDTIRSSSLLVFSLIGVWSTGVYVWSWLVR